MSERPKPTKAGKRSSKPPEPTGDSEDSGRGRDLSVGRTSSRKVESKGRAKTQSKWSLSSSQYISDSSEDSDKDGSTADSVGKRVRFRRSEELKKMVEGVNGEALTNFKIPKKPVTVVSDENPPEKAPQRLKQKLLAPSGVGLAGDSGDPAVYLGPSGKVLGYKIPDSSTASTSTEPTAQPAVQKEMYVEKGVNIPLRSKIGSGCYLPLVPAFGPGSGQPKLGPQGSSVRHTPYKLKTKVSMPVSIPVSEPS